MTMTRKLNIDNGLQDLKSEHQIFELDGVIADVSVKDFIELERLLIN